MKKGLQWAGVLEDIVSNPKRMADGLVYSAISPDASCLLALMDVQYSAESDRREKEDKVMAVFKMFLHDLQGNHQRSSFKTVSLLLNFVYVAYIHKPKPRFKLLWKFFV